MQPDPHVVYENETIVAIATPPGRGGIGIMRLSGAEATRIAEPMLRLRNPLAHAHARFGDLLDIETQEKIDEAVVTFFAAPHSYTGEDVVEVAAHGSPVVLETLVRQALKGGARMAAPGEFTQRAFLSGRIDLTQAEAVHDLIEAQTLYPEQIGIRKSREALADADLVLMVLDSTAVPGQEELELLSTLAQRRALVVVNKSDLALPSAAMDEALGELGLPVVHTSALSGEGVGELKQQMLTMVGDRTVETESGMLTSLRQYQAVTGTLESLEAASAAAGQNIPHEMVLLDLYNGLRHLDSLTGETTSDDILNLIFSTFCIGK